MRDIVTYQPPFGILGALANKLLISKKLNEIFSYKKSCSGKEIWELTKPEVVRTNQIIYLF